MLTTDTVFECGEPFGLMVVSAITTTETYASLSRNKMTNQEQKRRLENAEPGDGMLPPHWDNEQGLVEVRSAPRREWKKLVIFLWKNWFRSHPDYKINTMGPGSFPWKTKAFFAVHGDEVKNREPRDASPPSSTNPKN